MTLTLSNIIGDDDDDDLRHQKTDSFRRYENARGRYSSEKQAGQREDNDVVIK